MCLPQAQGSLRRGGAAAAPPPFKHHVGRDKGHRSDGNFSGHAGSLINGRFLRGTATRDGGSIHLATELNTGSATCTNNANGTTATIRQITASTNESTP